VCNFSDDVVRSSVNCNRHVKRCKVSLGEKAQRVSAFPGKARSSLWKFPRRRKISVSHRCSQLICFT